MPTSPQHQQQQHHQLNQHLQKLQLATTPNPAGCVGDNHSGVTLQTPNGANPTPSLSTTVAGGGGVGGVMVATSASSSPNTSGTTSPLTPLHRASPPPLGAISEAVEPYALHNNNDFSSDRDAAIDAVNQRQHTPVTSNYTSAYPPPTPPPTSPTTHNRHPRISFTDARGLDYDHSCVAYTPMIQQQQQQQQQQQSHHHHHQHQTTGTAAAHNLPKYSPQHKHHHHHHPGQQHQNASPPPAPSHSVDPCGQQSALWHMATMRAMCSCEHVNSAGDV